MFEVGVVGQFEAAHRLVGDFGPATRLHGHTYRLEVTLRGAALRSDGTLFDLARLQQAVTDLTETLHFRDLNDLPDLAGRNTTAETVADYCWERLAPSVDLPGAVLSVRVWESPRAWAGREDSPPG